MLKANKVEEPTVQAHLVAFKRRRCDWCNFHRKNKLLSAVGDVRGACVRRGERSSKGGATRKKTEIHKQPYIWCYHTTPNPVFAYVALLPKMASL